MRKFTSNINLRRVASYLLGHLPDHVSCHGMLTKDSMLPEELKTIGYDRHLRLRRASSVSTKQVYEWGATTPNYLSKGRWRLFSAGYCTTKEQLPNPILLCFFLMYSCGLLGTTTPLGLHASGLNWGNELNFCSKFTVSNTLKFKKIFIMATQILILTK